VGPPFGSVAAQITLAAPSLTLRGAPAPPMSVATHPGQTEFEGLDAASAAFEVGYQSATQFNREYKRLFGQPPIRDVKTRRFDAPTTLGD